MALAQAFDPIRRRGRRWRELLAVVLLCLVAWWATLHSPTIFFDNQILLGSSLGVFALLQFGWLGLPVGVTAALGTMTLWGHPWGALVLVLQLLWQQLFLSRFNGGPEQLGNGRIVLATIGFWLLIGLPLKTLLYTGLLQADVPSVLALGFKEAVVGVVNASLGLLLYLALQLLQLRRRRSSADLALRGLIFATLLVLISLPGVLIITVMGQQIIMQTIAQFSLGLEQQAQAVAFLLPAGSTSIPADAPFRQRLDHMAFEAVAMDGRRLSSNPALFTRLRQSYQPDRCSQLSREGLTLLVSKTPQPVLLSHQQGYWRYVLTPPSTTTDSWRQITVVQPSRQQIELLTILMRPSLQIMGLLLIAVALISEGVTSVLASQFNRIVSSLAAPSPGGSRQLSMPPLRFTHLRELNRVVKLINRQSRMTNELSAALEQSHRRLMESERQHRLLADNALDVITICDPTGRPTYISPSIEKVRGWTVAEAMALPMDQHLTPEGSAFALKALRDTEEAINQGLPLPSYRVEMQQSHKNGSWIWTDVTSSCIADPDGTYIGTLLVYRDITERKRLEHELQERASTDELTGLLNRRALIEQLEELLSHPDQPCSEEGLAVLFCDLDHFKEINDRLGHAAGDAVLRTVAKRIKHCIRSGDLAARTGGDELIVVLRAIADPEAAMAIAKKLGQSIAMPISAAAVKARITASIGMTMITPGEDVDTLLSRADIAMYQAKQAGRNHVMWIDASGQPEMAS